MSRLQTTVRDEASCRRHGSRRDRRARGPGREGARQYRPGHAPRLNPPLKEATMVSAPRLHTSAAHSPAGDGNQAIKTWPAVSLYLLVAWLAAGGRWSGASPSGHPGAEPDQPDPPPDKPTPPARAFSGQAETLHMKESDQ